MPYTLHFISVEPLLLYAPIQALLYQALNSIAKIPVLAAGYLCSNTACISEL